MSLSQATLVRASWTRGFGLWRLRLGGEAALRQLPEARI